MKRIAHITSYFGYPTDLAAEMRDWPEFVSGSKYDVRLTTKDGEISVTTRFVGGQGEDLDYVEVCATAACELFDRVLGRVIYAMAAVSDHLMVHRRDR